MALITLRHLKIMMVTKHILLLSIAGPRLEGGELGVSYSVYTPYMVALQKTFVFLECFHKIYSQTRS